MKYHLVAGGDSFVYGERCEDKKLMFVNIIGRELFESSFTNVGIRGASNDTISAIIVATLKDRMNNQPQGEPQKGNVVLVGWTGQMRFEISARNRIDLTTSVTDRDPTRDKKYRLPSFGNHIDRRLLQRMWSASVGYYRFLHAREYLLSFCALHKIKVVEFCTLPMFEAHMNQTSPWEACRYPWPQYNLMMGPLNNVNTDKALANLLYEEESLESFCDNYRKEHKDEMTQRYGAARLLDAHPTTTESVLIAEMLKPKFNFLYE